MKRFVTASTALFLLGLCLAVSSVQAQESKSEELIIITATNQPLLSLRDAADFVRANPPAVLFNEIPNFHLGDDTRAVDGGNVLGSDQRCYPAISYQLSAVSL